MRNRILAAIVTLGCAAMLAALPVTTAQAATGTAPDALCPAGVTNIIYCAAVCPSGSSLEGGLCVTAAGVTVLPEGPPEVYDWKVWGAKLNLFDGPAVKFKLRNGINGAPDLKSFTLILPAGLSFAHGAFGIGISFAERKLTTTTSRLTATIRSGLPTLSIYIHNHSLRETDALRRALASGHLKTLRFRLLVTDAGGLTTRLAFVVKPRG